MQVSVLLEVASPLALARDTLLHSQDARPAYTTT